MSEQLPDVQLTEEQEVRSREMATQMALSYWGVYAASRVIVHLQDAKDITIAELSESLRQACARRDELVAENERLGEFIESEWFNRVTYKQQARAALDRVAELERGEFICKSCGLRKNGEIDGTPDF